MTRISILFIVLVLSQVNVYAQSISVTELESYLILQNTTAISNSVLKKGFSLLEEGNEYGQANMFIKEGRNGSEGFMFGASNELFTVGYMIASQYYKTYKEILKTPDLTYAYSGNGNVYFENDLMRVGFNDKEGIITLFVNIVNDKDTKNKNASKKVHFNNYKVKDLGSISIPDNLEIQSGLYKKFSESTSQTNSCYAFEILEDRVVFQQMGVNEFKKTNTYARIIIQTQISETEYYEELREPINITRDELYELNIALENEIKSAFCDNQKVLRWYGTEILKVNDYYAIMVSYIRQLENNPPVIVEYYRFPNNDRVHEITMSYRFEDEELWKPLFVKTKESLIINEIY